MALPFTDVLEETEMGHKKKFAARREAHRRRTKQMANLLVALSNFYELGAPRGAGPLHFASHPLTTAQQAAAERFLSDAEAFCVIRRRNLRRYGTRQSDVE